MARRKGGANGSRLGEGCVGMPSNSTCHLTRKLLGHGASHVAGKLLGHATHKQLKLRSHATRKLVDHVAHDMLDHVTGKLLGHVTHRLLGHVADLGGAVEHRPVRNVRVACARTLSVTTRSKQRGTRTHA
eukprot:2735041-Rhodomonas_salina.2